MSMMSRLMGRVAKLPPAETHDTGVEKDLQIPIPDGIALLADHYYPRNLGPRPTILMRSVYSDRTKGGWTSELLAERGFHVLVVSGRGTHGSGGELNPFRQEHDDGVAVLSWLEQQNWFNGELGTTGASYLGYTQWAIARDAGPMLKAMSTQLVGSNIRSMIYPGEAFYLEVFLFWLSIVDSQEKSLLSHLINMFVGVKRRRKAVWHLPPVELDQVAVGKPYGFWREWLAHDQPGNKWWAPGDHSSTVSNVMAPNHLVGGWYDFFLPQMLRDYSTLKKAGRQPYLTVGPWTHFAVTGASTGMREAIIWLRTQLLGDRRDLREAPVRIFVMGVNEWRDLPAWPPADIKEQRWYLQPGGGLATDLPPQSDPDHYRYDPRDPTPSVGGARSWGEGPPVQDNCSLESRADVLTYTSVAFDHDKEIIGPITAELYIRSSLEHTDFFVRLCDVMPSGTSMNVCDGLLRLFPDQPVADVDGCRKVVIELWPTAYRFRRRHRIRVQVASGSFPRWGSKPRD